MRSLFRNTAPGSRKTVRWAIGLAGAVVLLMILVAGIDPQDPADVWLFVGRFHPLLVHLPIGILLIALAMEVLAHFQSFDRLRGATPFLFAAGGISAAVACVAGYLLSLEGGYEPDAVELHMWLGIGVAVIALAATAVKLMPATWLSVTRRKIQIALFVILAGLLGLTGHFGGTLTHGPTYLTQYMPTALHMLVGTDASRKPVIANIDSAVVFSDLVQPILERRCVTCHNATKKKGKLSLETSEEIQKGGREGAVIAPGEPTDSDLLRRITLPPAHADAMPPDGETPLEIGETEVIRWWIAHGASFQMKVAEIDSVPTSVATYLARLGGLREEPRTGVYAIEAPPLDSTTVAASEQTGLEVRRLAHNVPLLHVSAVRLGDDFGDSKLDVLLPLAQNITWLDLRRTHVSDAGLAKIAAFENLTRLHLDHTAVTDDGLYHLVGQRRLEYLNLVGTEITDAGLAHLAEIPSLKRLYVWRTEVTAEGAERLRSQVLGLYVNVGAKGVAADTVSVVAGANIL